MISDQAVSLKHKVLFDEVYETPEGVNTQVDGKLLLNPLAENQACNIHI